MGLTATDLQDIRGLLMEFYKGVISPRFDEIDGDLVSIKAEITVMRADINNIYIQLSIIKNDIQELKGRVTALENDITEIYTMLKSIQKHSVADKKKAKTELDKRLAAIRSEFYAILQSVTIVKTRES